MNSTTHSIARIYAAKTRSHPLIIAAAIAVILFSGVGIGVMTGLIPTANSKPGTANPVSIEGADAKAVTQKNNPPVCANCGVVRSVRAVENERQASGLGALAGGITGAVVGSQIGEGQGKSLATVAAAVGGAVAGNSIEKNMHKTRTINVNVRMEDGTTRTVQMATDPGLLPGDKVKVVDGGLARR